MFDYSPKVLRRGWTSGILLQRGLSGLRVLSGNNETEIATLIATAEQRLVLCAPFITESGAKLVAKRLSSKLRKEGEMVLLTDCSAVSVQGGSLDLRAILSLLTLVKTSKAIHVPNLHAKVFIADDGRAIVTSANLTEGGMRRNVEIGTLLENPDDVAALLTTILNIASNGRRLTTTDLETLAELSNDMPRIAVQPDRTLQRAFSRLLKSVSDSRESQRLRPIFANTILKALKSGPMLARELERRVREQHPELCDDTKYRAIAKKIVWRHEVHWALQELKHDKRVVHMAAKGEPGPWALPSQIPSEQRSS